MSAIVATEPGDNFVRFYDQHRAGSLEKKMAAFHVGTIA